MIRRMIEGGSNRIKASDWNKIAEAVERAQSPLAGGASKPMRGNCWLYNRSTDNGENRVTPAFTLVPLFPIAYMPYMPPNLDDLNTLHEPVLQFERNGNISPRHEYYDKEIKAKYPNSTNSKYAVTLSETKPGEICRGIVGGGVVPVLTTVHSMNHRFVRAYYDTADPARFLKTETHPFEGFRIITQFSRPEDIGENKICLVSLDHDHVIFENPYKGPFAISVVYQKVVDTPADPEANPPVEEQSHMGAFVKVDSGYCNVSGTRFHVSEKIFEREILFGSSTPMFKIVLKYDSALGQVVILEQSYGDTAIYTGTDPSIYIGGVSQTTGITQSLHGHAYLFRLKTFFCPELEKEIVYIDPC